MPGFILCIDCGENLGEVAEFVNMAKHGFIKKIISESDEYKEFCPEKLVLNADAIPPIGDILDAVGLTNMCCRVHILSYADFYMNYKRVNK